MTLAGWAMIALFTVLVVALARPAGNWMHALYSRDTLRLGGIERGLYRLAGVDPNAEQNWVGYAASLCVFNLGGIAFLFAVLKLQAVLPLNPQGVDFC